jgi:uncharacterized membrane protein SirB2
VSYIAFRIIDDVSVTISLGALNNAFVFISCECSRQEKIKNKTGKIIPHPLRTILLIIRIISVHFFEFRVEK